MSDGADADLFAALTAACDKEGTQYEVIAPKIGGVILSDKKKLPAQQKIDGGPSVLYDAVVLLPAAEAMDDLLQESAARDFVADAFAQ